MKKIWIVVFISIAFLTGCNNKKEGKSLQEIKQESMQAMQTSAHGSMTGDPHAGMMMEGDPHAGMMMEGDPHAGMDVETLKNMGMTIERERTAVDSGLTWKVPETLIEKTTSGMRLATFKEKANPEAVDISVIALGAQAGDIFANVTRWAGQLSLTLDRGEVNMFIKQAEGIITKSGAQGTLFDFTMLQENRDQTTTKSMIATIIRMNGSVVFVKMTGTIEDVLRNKKAFTELVKSIDVVQ